MTPTLLRNCLHGGNAYFLEMDDSEFTFIKSSSDKNAINDLANEHKGWNWYSGQLGYQSDKLAILEKVTSSYARLRIRKFFGNKLPVSYGLKGKENSLNAVSDHYIKIWGPPSNQKFPIHGDLSLDNIIFDNETVRIIDWEHFKIDCAPWGFDLLHLFFETYWFGTQKFFFNKTFNLELLSCCFKYLIVKHNVADRYLLDPLETVIGFINENKRFWGQQLVEYPEKLPVLLFSDQDIRFIDGFLNSRIKVLGGMK